MVTNGRRSQASMEMYFRSRSGSGADPSDPARKLKKALTRGRICRDGNSQVAAFSTKHGKWWQEAIAFPPAFFAPRSRVSLLAPRTLYNHLSLFSRQLEEECVKRD